MQQSKQWIHILFLLATLGWAAACGQSSSDSRNRPAPAQANQDVSSRPDSAIARIVFIDQAHACECTQNRITASWTALQAALGENSPVSIERIHRDTQEELAEEYSMLRPLVTIPGIYLLDENGAVVELLQGEVTESQLRIALGNRG